MTDAAAEDQDRLAHLPVTFFAVVMGLAGLTLALHRAELAFGWPHAASLTTLWASGATFVAIAGLYLAKVVRHPDAVAAEWHHPVKLAFFPAISISILLIATALRPFSEAVAHALWLLGVTAQGALTLAVLSGWIGKRPFQPMHISPAWFIPAVGNVLVPLAGVPLGYLEVPWLFFSAGMLFWLVLLTLVFNRLIFHDPLPGRLYPTLAILIAPPAVGMLAWLQLNGGSLDAVARGLYALTILFAALFATQVPGLRRLPFALSWWALSFPLAALTVATFVHADQIGSNGYRVAGALLLVLLAATITGLVLRTGAAIARGEICRPE